MTTFWSLLAALCAVGAEYLYRTLKGPWISHIYLWIPIQLTIGFAIYKLVTSPGVPLISALIMWSVCVIGLRILVSMLLGDAVSIGTWVAVCLMFAARIAQQVWR